ncbi:AsmA family protein [Flavobacterium rhizosphaerae]|uniref:hypothetical protein n=1 Tax=Flavobacterium rhizosphaerae TaxID=3163298 RepID=UPI0038B62D40
MLLNKGAEYYIAKKLPSILNSEKDFPYYVSYSDMDVNLISGNFTIYNAKLTPKDSTDGANRQGMFGNIEKLEVKHLDLWKLWREKNVDVKKVILNRPDVNLYPKNKDEEQDTVKKPFKNSITAGTLQIKDGRFALLDSAQQPALLASHISFELSNITADSVTVAQKIPVTYKDYAFSCDSLYYDAGVNYKIYLGSLNVADSAIAAKDFRMMPKQTRREYTRMIPVEHDQYTVNADSIGVKKIDWGYNNDTLYIHTPEVVLQNVFANVYRSKEPKDDPSIKKLYSNMLRSIKFDLKADKIMLKNSTIEYEEQNTFSRPPAKVEFSKFYASVYNIYSPVGKDTLPDTKIDVQCLFMKAAPLNVAWTFNTLDKSDSFTIIGNIQNLPSQYMNKISKPLMNVTTQGTLNNIKFTFNGNRERGSGHFAINYEDLKVELYKSDGSKKHKLKTFLGNLLVKNDSNGGKKEADVSVERKKDKSVFNFLWLFLQEGLKETMLPGLVTTVI